MSTKVLIKNSLYYTIGNILPQATAFFLIPIYTIYLSPEQYGIVNSMTALSSVIGIILSLGIERGIYRIYYDYPDDEKKDYLGTIILGQTIISIITFCFFLIFPKLLNSLYKSIPFYPYYLIMLITTITSRVITIPSIYLRISEQATKYIRLAVISFFLTTCLNLIFIVYYKEGALGMLKGSLYTNVIMGPIFVLYTKSAIRLKFKYKYFQDSIRFSLPLLPGFIFAWILNLSDRVFLEKYLSLNEVGIYSLGARIASIITVIAGGIFNAYTPHFYKIANENSIEAKKTIFKYNNAFIIMLISMCFLVAFFSQELIELLFPLKYSGASRIIPLMVIAIFFSQITGFLNLMIYQQKKSLQIMYITLFAAIVNIGCNSLFIPMYGMIGSALASISSFLFMFGVEYLYAKKCYFIPFNYKIITPLVILAIILYFLMNQLAFMNPIHSILLKVSLLLLIIVFIHSKYVSHIKKYLKQYKSVAT